MKSVPPRIPARVNTIDPSELEKYSKKINQNIRILNEVKQNTNKEIGSRIEHKKQNDLLFCFFKPNDVKAFNVNNNSIHTDKLNLNFGSLSLIHNQDDSTIYYFYGKSHLPNTSNTALRINLKTKKVEKLRDSHLSKLESSVPVAHLQKLYFFGGLSIANQKSADSEYFDKLTETWTVISPMLVPSTHTSGVDLSDEIYLTSNELRSVIKYYPKTDIYEYYFDSKSADLPNSYVFLAAAGEKLFYFYNKGIFRIDQPGKREKCESYGVFASCGSMTQYLARADKIFILMSSNRVLEFSFSKDKGCQARRIRYLE